MESTFDGVAYVLGSASGMLLSSNVELSVWGGVDQQSGKVIDKHHPLCGRYLRDNILAIPGGRGSCSGSGVILELLLNGQGPRAIIFERCEDIITLGIMVAEEIFGKSIPVVMLAPKDFQLLMKQSGKPIRVDGSKVSLIGPDGALPGQTTSPSVVDAEDIFRGVRLHDVDRAFLYGFHGEAARVAIRIILRMAKLMGASELMDITQAHVDGCHYTGPGSLAFAKKMRDLGGKVRVPTTLNAISIDRRRWRALGVDADFSKVSAELADAYVDMGARPTFTCAPYQLDSAPKQGDQIAWAESNAVVYVNSVLGARSMKYPDFLDIAIALTARAPNAGVHLTSGRLASLCVRVPEHPKVVDDSFYALLGYVIGSLSTSSIPVVIGLEARNPSKDDLRAFGASFATMSSAPMFHVVGVTPEAPTLAAASRSDGLPAVDLDWSQMNASWKGFNQISKGAKVDLVSLGNPHMSFAEIKRLSQLCHGRTKHTDVAVMVTCGRSVHGLATQAGHVALLEQFGVQFITDTCWCMIVEPVIPRQAQVIMTNSGKYSHYGPGLTGRQFCFGGLEACVEVACRGVWCAENPAWLNINSS